MVRNSGKPFKNSNQEQQLACSSPFCNLQCAPEQSKSKKQACKCCKQLLLLQHRCSCKDKHEGLTWWFSLGNHRSQWCVLLRRLAACLLPFWMSLSDISASCPRTALCCYLSWTWGNQEFWRLGLVVLQEGQISLVPNQMWRFGGEGRVL